MTWLLCDYGEVLCRAQSDEAQATLAETAGIPAPEFFKRYWAPRLAYDRGDLTAGAFWETVLGETPPPRLLHQLISLDVASWVHPLEPTLAATARAGDRGLRLALFSNAPHEVADTLDGLPWLQDFEPRLFSCRLRAAKPEPEAYAKVAAALGSDPSDIVFFDDRPENVAGARAAGFRAEQFTHPAQLDAVLP